MIGRRKRMSRLLFSRMFLIGQCWGKMRKKVLTIHGSSVRAVKWKEENSLLCCMKLSVCQTTAVHLHYQVSKAWVSGAHEFDYLLY